MAKIDFTKSQQDVIDHKGNNLLVFASAGSGKTAVIIEKIAQSIISGSTTLDKLLVVTFTESATAEMKQRLYDKLSENIDKPNIKDEIEKLSLADISTLHGFCQRLIKQYFFELDIEPTFSIFSDEEANFYKIKAIDYLLREKQEQGSDSFISLCEMFYNNRSLVSLKSNVLDFYNFLQSLDNKDEYMSTTATSCYTTDLKKNNACKFVVERFSKDYLYFKTAFDSLKIVSQQAGEEKITKAIEVVTDALIKTKIKTFEEMFEYFKVLDKIKSPFGLKIESDILKEARSLWTALGALIDDFFKICGEDEDITKIAENIKASEPAVKEFLSLVSDFEKEYTKIKKQKKALDFDDLEKYALKLLENEKLRESIQEKYDVLYIDEYQDINSKQEKILSYVTSGDNMVMVGDLKQSIYGFRNSSPEILIYKTALYKKNVGGKLITLKENFRSNPIILDFVNKIFNRVMKENFGGIDYKKDGAFKGAAKYKKVDDYKEVSIDFIKYKDREKKEPYFGDVYSVTNDTRSAYVRSVAKVEAKVIAEKIKKMLGKPYYDAKKKDFFPLEYKNFTILCRSKSYIKELAMYLQKYEIPCVSKTSDNIYNNPDILFLLNILKVVNNPQDDLALASILSSPFFGITFDDLATIKKNTNQEYFYDCVKEYLDNNDNNLTCKLNKAYGLVYKLREMKDFSTIYDLLIYADRALGILNYYLLLPDSRAKHKVLQNFIEQFNFVPYNNDINEYLNYVDSYLKDTEITMVSPSGDDCVHIDTIHSSKGLEYEVVFVAGCGKQFSNITTRQDILRDKDLGVGINAYDIDEHIKYKTLTKQAIIEKVRLQEKLEESRLLYVALTRAKNSLNIICSFDTDNIEELSEYAIRKSNKYANWVLAAFEKPLIDNIRTCEEEKTFNYNDHYEVNVHLPEKLLEAEELVNVEDVLLGSGSKTTEIKEYLEKEYPYKDSFAIAQKNTVTSLMMLEAESSESLNPAPRKFGTDEHSAKALIDYALLGTIYHKILQEIDFEIDSVEKVEAFVNLCKENDSQNALYYDKVDCKKIFTCIKKIYPLIKNKEVEKEKQFVAYLPHKDIIEGSLLEDKVLLQGVIDLMVGNGGNVDIIDYKTTRVENSEQLVEKYYVQMKLYKLAAERAVGKKVENVYIYSLHLDSLIKII